MAYIADLIGIPYKEHGRDKTGYDCYGLAIEAAARFGYKLDDVLYDNHDLELSDKKRPTLNITPTDKPAAGVLLEMEYENELHVGICLNATEFIHTTKSGSRVNRIGVLPVRGLYVINSRI